MRSKSSSQLGQRLWPGAENCPPGSWRRALGYLRPSHELEGHPSSKILVLRAKNIEHLCRKLLCYLFFLPSTIRDTISAPTPDWGHPCSTETRWFVFFTDSKTVSKSNGLKLLKLITSASIPAALSSFAASKLVWTAREKATKVTCLPVYKFEIRYCCVKIISITPYLPAQFWLYQLEWRNL